MSGDPNIPIRRGPEQDAGSRSGSDHDSGRGTAGGRAGPIGSRGAGRSARRRRGVLWWALALTLLITPLLEIYVLIQVGQAIGPWWTILLLLLSSMVGAWLIKREGARAWRALTTAIGEGRAPGKEIADGALVLIGGTLMLAPGFVTDVIGLLLVLPVTRPLFRLPLAALAARRVAVIADVASMSAESAFRTQQRPGTDPGGPVVRGEVVDE